MNTIEKILVFFAKRDKPWDPSVQQRAVMDWVVNGTGSLNLVSRAGTGKSTTIVNGILFVIYNMLPNCEAVAMAFNKNAGDELKNRIAALGMDWKRASGGTFHSYGLSAFKRYAPDAKTDKDKVEKIVTKLINNPETKRDVARDCGPQIRPLVSLAKQSALGVGTSIDDEAWWYTTADHHGINEIADEYDIGEIIEVAVKVFKISISQNREVIDFDDMIFAPLYHKVRFYGKDFVIIDEAQDTNRARRLLAEAMLKRGTGRLIAVGDDRQAIYGFTGADSDAMDLIQKRFKSAILKLTVTYRCPKIVVEMAKKIVNDYEAHPSAPQGSYRKMSQWENEVVVGKKGPQKVYWFEKLDKPLGYGDAIICRNTKYLVDEAYNLLRHGIGCIVEGREIGTGLIKLATKWRINNITALLPRLEEYKEREVKKWEAKKKPERADAIADKVDTLMVLIEKCAEDKKDTISELVEFIGSLFGDSNDPKAPKVVRLLTIHRSKGMEYLRVFMLGREKLLPSKWAKKDHQLLQEENLEYVMMTRAIQFLADVVLKEAA